MLLGALWKALSQHQGQSTWALTITKEKSFCFYSHLFGNEDGLECTFYDLSYNAHATTVCSAGEHMARSSSSIWISIRMSCMLMLHWDISRPDWNWDAKETVYILNKLKLNTLYLCFGCTTIMFYLGLAAFITLASWCKCSGLLINLLCLTLRA